MSESFAKPRGTRGARMPRGRVVTWLNKLISGRARKGGRMMGMDVLVLHTVGARSGQVRQTPVAWFSGTGGTLLVVASAGGSAKNPAWYFNIAAHPDRVAVDVGGRHLGVTPVELHGDERAAAWSQIVAASPRFGKYEAATDRLIPVIRLTPRP